MPARKTAVARVHSNMSEAEHARIRSDLAAAPINKGTRNKYQSVYMTDADHELLDEIIARLEGGLLGRPTSRSEAIRYCIAVANEATVPFDPFEEGR